MSRRASSSIRGLAKARNSTEGRPGSPGAKPGLIERGSTEAPLGVPCGLACLNLGLVGRPWITARKGLTFGSRPSPSRAHTTPYKPSRTVRRHEDSLSYGGAGDRPSTVEPYERTHQSDEDIVIVAPRAVAMPEGGSSRP